MIILQKINFILYYNIQQILNFLTLWPKKSYKVINIQNIIVKFENLKHLLKLFYYILYKS